MLSIASTASRIRLLLPLAVALSSLVLTAACGDSEPTPTPTVLPTQTPTTVPTPTSTPTAAPVLAGMPAIDTETRGQDVVAALTRTRPRASVTGWAMTPTGSFWTSR